MRRVIGVGTDSADDFTLPADVLAALDARYAPAGGTAGSGAMLFRGPWAPRLPEYYWTAADGTLPPGMATNVGPAWTIVDRPIPDFGYTKALRSAPGLADYGVSAMTLTLPAPPPGPLSVGAVVSSNGSDRLEVYQQNGRAPAVPLYRSGIDTEPVYADFNVVGIDPDYLPIYGPDPRIIFSYHRATQPPAGDDCVYLYELYYQPSWAPYAVGNVVTHNGTVYLLVDASDQGATEPGTGSTWFAL